MAAVPSSEVLAAFGAEGCRSTRLGSGNINDTYLVSPGSSLHKPFVLQRINSSVFPHPESLIHNYQLVWAHFQSKTVLGNVPVSVARPVPNEPEGGFFRDASGDFWRAQSYFTDYQTAAVASCEDAYRIGRALALFHQVISGIDLDALHDPLPGFHNLPGYLQSYRAVLRNQTTVRAAGKDLLFCRAAVDKYRSQALELSQAESSGRIGLQPIHGDPKCDNFLFHPDGDGVAVIDLDTVGAGLVAYDLGDCLRSLGNRAGESAGSKTEVALDLGLCRAFAAGYADASSLPRKLLQECFYTGLLTVTYELAVRFLTDHLLGDVYFKTAYVGENLEKAVAQFRLLESVVSQRRELLILLDGQ